VEGEKRWTYLERRIDHSIEIAGDHGAGFDSVPNGAWWQRKKKTDPTPRNILLYELCELTSELLFQRRRNPAVYP